MMDASENGEVFATDDVGELSLSDGRTEEGDRVSEGDVATVFRCW